jgi:hypothetical protein
MYYIGIMIELTKMNKLKPCPFCGETPIKDGYSGDFEGYRQEYKCVKCDLWGITPDWWNIRPETAWEMFRDLRNLYGGRFFFWIMKYCEMPKDYDAYQIIRDFVEYDEQKAIEIMKKAKEQLK